MDVRPVLLAEAQVLTAVEARGADVAEAAAQVAAWDRDRLRVPRAIVGIPGPPDPTAVEAAIAAAGIGGTRLALALPEAWLDAEGMEDALRVTRERTGVLAVVADFGSGQHPDLEFLVSYPADVLALSSRILAGVETDPAAQARVSEAATVATELGWRVIAPNVQTVSERQALAAAGVPEVAGPGVAPFEDPTQLSRLLGPLRVTLPDAPEPSRRAPARTPAAPASAPATTISANPAQATAAATATAGSTQASPGTPAHPTPWTTGGKTSVKRDPRIAVGAASSGSASAAASDESAGPILRTRPRRSPVGFILLILLLIAVAAYVVLAYQDVVPSPW